MQSKEELYDVLKSNKEAIDQNDLGQTKTVVVSIAPQSVASIAAKYDLSPLQVKLTFCIFLILYPILIKIISKKKNRLPKD